MDIKRETVNQTMVLRLSGKFDFLAHSKLLDTLESITPSQASKIVLDLHNVPFIDSLAIGLLVTAYKKLRTQSVQMILVCPESNSVVKGILQSLKIPELIPTFPSLDQSLESA